MLTALLIFIRIPDAAGHDAHLSITMLIALLLIASGIAMATRWVRAPHSPTQPPALKAL